MPLSDDELQQFRDLLKTDQSQAARSAVITTEGSPDEAAKTLNNSVREGVPYAYGALDQQSFNQDAENAHATRIADNDPVIQRYLANHDFAASVSKDDLEPLAKISPNIAWFAKTEARLGAATWDVIKETLHQTFMEAPGEPTFQNLEPLIRQKLSASGLSDDQINREVDLIKGRTIRGDIMQRVLNIPMLALSPVIAAFREFGSKPLEEAGGPPAQVTETAAMIAGTIAGLRVGHVYARAGESPHPAINPIIDKALIEETKADVQKFKDVLGDVEASKTLQRSPEAFKTFVNEATQGAEVGLPVDAIIEKFGDRAAKQFEWLPDFQEQFERAQVTGGDIRMPVADWLAHGKDIARELQDDTRLHPNGLTTREADELAKAPPEAYPTEPVIPPTPESDFKVATDIAQRETWTRPLIQQQVEVEGVKPLFNAPEALNMTQPEWAAYNKRIEAIKQTQDEAAIKYAEKGIAKRQTEEWKANERRVRQETETDLSYRTDLLADRFFRTGYLGPNKAEPFKLDAKLILAKYGKETLDGLPKGVARLGGVDPNDAAPMFGYHSGDALVHNLELLENTRRQQELTPAEYNKQIVDQVTAERMEKQFGKLEENILAEAREAVGSAGQANLLAEEMFILARQLGELPPTFTKEFISGRVREIFNGTKATDAANVGKWTREVGRAGRQAELALLKGNIQEAFKAKQRQVYGFNFLREAQAFSKEVKKAERLYDTYAKRPQLPAVEQEYANWVHKVLQHVGYDIKRNPAELQRAIGSTHLRDFIQEKLENAQDMYMPEWLDTMGPLKYEDMTTEQWRDVRDTIVSLDHNGRDTKRVTLLNKTMELDAVGQQVRENLATLPERPHLDPGTMRGRLRELKIIQLRPELMADWFDRHDPGGPFSQMFQTLRDAYGKKLDLNKADAQAIRGLSKGLKEAELEDTVPNSIGLKGPNTNREMVITKDVLLGMALHSGNSVNFGKMARGWKQDPTVLRQFILDNISKDGWDWVQGVWDLFDKKFALADETARRMSGVGPTKVEAEPLVTPHGTYAGGYMRLKPDPIEREAATVRPGAKMGAFAEQSYYDPTPRKNFLRDRTGADYPILLSARDFIQAFQETNHYIALAEPIKDALKFYNHNEIKGAIREKFGQEYVQSFEPWLKDIATDGFSRYEQDKGMQTLNWLAGAARRNWVMAEMGYRLSTVQKHGLGALSNSITQVGARPLGIAIKEILSDSSVKEKIFADSPMMRNRMQTMDRDMGDALARSYGENTIRATAEHYAFHWVSSVDYASALPTYWAEYKKVLGQTGDERIAITAGERAVALAHGGSTIVDLPSLLRSRNEFMRLGTVAMSFWNATYNKFAGGMRLTKEGIWDIKNQEFDSAKAKLSKAAVTTLMTPVLLALGEQLVSPMPREKDEPFALYAAKVLGRVPLSTIPWARDFAHALMTGKVDVQTTPVANLVMSSFKGIHGMVRMAEGKKPAPTWLRSLIEAPGAFTSLPGIGQAGATLQFLWNWNTGRDKVSDPIDFWRGITRGHAQEKVK